MAAPDIAEVSLRDRAWWAACRIHGSSVSNVKRCEVGERITDAVLAEVREWLVEQAADVFDHDPGTALVIADLADQAAA